MQLSLTTPTAAAKFRFSVPVALMCLAATLLPATMTHRAAASDLDFSSAAAESGDANYLRLGLNKSAVIKLPATVADVVVGNPGVVDVVIRNKNTAYLFGLTAAQTNVFFFDADGREILQLDLEVTLDGKALKKLIDRTVPGNKVQVDTTGNNIVLRGMVANATEAKVANDLAVRAAGAPELVVNALTISGGDQVMLKVRIVEVQRSVLKSLGIDLNAAFSVGNLTAGLSTANPVIGSALSAGASFVSGDFSADASISAMEQQGLVRVLAEPTLTSISGQRAQFLAGGQFPYISGRDCDDNGFCTNQITYKDFGVKLGFTPMVMSEGRIELKIATEVSELSDTVSGALSTRAAETTIELPSGGSMMLAGLIKDTTTQQVSGTPGLKNVPILGALFRSRNFTSGQTELAVLVTPYIVKPVSERELATPDERLGIPSDPEQMLWGKLNRVYGTAGKSPNGVYHGQVGYIIE